MRFQVSQSDQSITIITKKWYNIKVWHKQISFQFLIVFYIFSAYKVILDHWRATLEFLISNKYNAPVTLPGHSILSVPLIYCSALSDTFKIEPENSIAA